MNNRKRKAVGRLAGKRGTKGNSGGEKAEMRNHFPLLYQLATAE